MKYWGMLLRGRKGEGGGGVCGGRGVGGGGQECKQTCTCAGSGAASQQAQSLGGKCLLAVASQFAAEHHCSGGRGPHQ